MTQCAVRSERNSRLRSSPFYICTFARSTRRSLVALGSVPSTIRNSVKAAARTGTAWTFPRCRKGHEWGLLHEQVKRVSSLRRRVLENRTRRRRRKIPRHFPENGAGVAGIGTPRRDKFGSGMGSTGLGPLLLALGVPFLSLLRKLRPDYLHFEQYFAMLFRFG